MWKNIRDRNFERARRPVRWFAGILFATLATVALTACAESTPTPSPTSTPAPTPTAGPTQAPLTVLEDISLPAPDPERLAELSRLFTFVPEDFNSAVVMDIQALEESPLLRDAVSLDALGLQGMLPIEATRLLDVLGLALGESGKGAITLMSGPLDVESLLRLAGGFGISLGGPEPQAYRDHRVWSVDVFGISLAVGEANPTTVVLSSGSPGDGTPALDLVKGSLDSFDGLAPNLLDHPGMNRLLKALPSGFATTLLGRCRDLEAVAAVVDLGGCATAGVSAGLSGEGDVVLWGLVSFESETLASAALQLALERIESGAKLTIGELAVGHEKELVWTRIIVDPEQVAQAIETFSLPKQ